MIIQTDALFYALSGGIIPAVVWLLFWLREDSSKPEPTGLLTLTFFGGMLMVPLVIPFQKLTLDPNSELSTFLWWAGLEEVFKYFAAYFIALKHADVDEPIDPLIYMMTAALGFAALENSLFIVSPLLDGNITESIITGNLRFVGATLLHTISSAAVGACIALVFYKGRVAKQIATFIGLIIAITLHTLFNLLIIKEVNGVTLATFGFVWIGIVILMLLFERVKRIYPVNKIN